MADDSKQTSALLKRHEQLKRWNESDTNRAADTPRDKPRKVKFQDGCVFLAACSSGDTEEVARLLRRGADINTANVDGLTALHQACIDDNQSMVEFLVENGADVDVCDNEGWTPLHATASCGFTEIARYLLEQKANVAAVNNDGDLAIDICEDKEMRKILQEEMDNQGVDADAARSEEENQMLQDANKWLNNKSVKEKKHPKTGATALHVAAAKGYTKVMSILLKAGADVNSQDYDGWTPLHAAAHWGQEETCKLLVEHMCDMQLKNNAGQTPYDVADSEVLKLLEELERKQASQKDLKDSQNEIIPTRGQHQKRSRSDSTREPLANNISADIERSSVTRMSVDQKHNVNVKTVEQERAALEAALQSPTEEEEKVLKSSSSSASEEESSEDSESKSQPEENAETSPKSTPTTNIESGTKSTEKTETEKQNELNRLSSNQVPRERDKPPIVETKDVPKVDEKGETTHVSIKDKINEDAVTKPKEETPTIEKIGDSLRDTRSKLRLRLKEIAKETEEKAVSDSKPEKSDSAEKEEKARTGVSGQMGLSRSLSMPAHYRSEVPIISLQKPGEDNPSTAPLRETPSWRAGLRKTGSTSMVNDSLNENDKNNLPRSASSPRLALNNNNRLENDKSNRPFLSTSTISENQENKVPDRLGSSSVSTTSSTSTTLTSTTSLRGPSSFRGLSSYKQRLEEFKEDHRSSLPTRLASQPATTASSALTPSATVTTVGLTTGTTTSISSSIISSPYSNYQFKRPYGIPKRDEEAETQRKARAKRARETRRSTQGVTREDIQKAEEVLSGTARTETDKRLAAPDSGDKPLNKEADTSTTSLSERITSENDTIALRRNREDEPRSNSFRRSRDSKDSTDSYTPYLRRDRIDRNAISLNDPSSSLGSSSGITRSQSLRTRIRNGELESRIEEKSNDSDSKGDKDGRRESSALARRRRRNERRSTGIVSYDNKDEEEEKDKEEEPADDKVSDRKRLTMSHNHRYGVGSSYPNLSGSYSGSLYGSPSYGSSLGSSAYSSGLGSGYSSRAGSTSSLSSIGSSYVPSVPSYRTSGRYGRYPSTSDVSDRYRPSSYTETSKSTSAIDTSLDYKKLYEDEKSNSERLKRELSDTKKELLEAKGELDRLLKRSEHSRLSDTNEKREKRALERKLSEYEEELKKMEALKEDNKRLKEENGALIRVISKLSK
ncbi:protein phosphatase 1 regulatory subunit 12A [Magallana gigas]|uniref:protein phosphatase 1 regulatory subunit 12A n=1 Tax=Magallana gigas TaxID=29159 RepID=UPI00333F2FD7